MRSWRSSGSIFGQEIRFEKTEIDRMCEDALREAKMLPAVPEPIRIDRFIEKHFECRFAYEDIAEGVLGCTMFKADGGIALVAVSPSLDDGTVVGRRRFRSTAAHEAGHCLMHPILFMQNPDQMNLEYRENLDFGRRRIMCRSEDLAGRGGKRYDGRWWEYQANRAIGGLLLPKPLVREAIVHLLKAVGLLGTETLAEPSRKEAESIVTERFDVNPVVARIRLAEMFPETEQMVL